MGWSIKWELIMPFLVVNVIEPLVLINPIIEDQWEEIDYYEGCLSYPNQGIKTKRNKHIIIKTTAQELGGWYFTGLQKVVRMLEVLGKGNRNKTNKKEEY